MVTMRYSEPPSHRNSVSSEFEEAVHKFQEYMYKDMALKYSIAHFNKCNLYAVDYSELSLYEYYSGTFESTRRSLGWENNDIFRTLIERDNYVMIENIENSQDLCSFITSDKKIIVKIINNSEAKLISRFLKEYVNRVTSSTGTGLLKILGVYKILPKESVFVIMENLCRSDEISSIYEFNGESLASQSVKSFTKGITSRHTQITQIHLNIPSSHEFLKAIEDDIKLLERFNIIGYTLAVVCYDKEPIDKKWVSITDAHGNILRICIFDYTSFTALKYCSLLCKCCVKNKALRFSAKKYRRRLLNILSKITDS